MCISKCLCVYLLCLYVVVFNNTHDERIYIPRRMPSHDVCVCVFRITIGISVYISKCLCVYLLCLYVVVFNNTHDERIYIPRRMPSHDVCVCVFRITIGIYVCIYQNVCVCICCVYTLLFLITHTTNEFISYIPRRMPSHDACVCACFVLQSVYIMCLSKCSYVCVFVVCILYNILLFLITHTHTRRNEFL